MPADRSALKPGETVFFGAEKAADGTLTPTGRIQVSRTASSRRCKHGDQTPKKARSSRYVSSGACSAG
jgi:hypothetical protein